MSNTSSLGYIRKCEEFQAIKVNEISVAPEASTVSGGVGTSSSILSGAGGANILGTAGSSGQIVLQTAVGGASLNGQPGSSGAISLLTGTPPVVVATGPAAVSGAITIQTGPGGSGAAVAVGAAAANVNLVGGLGGVGTTGGRGGSIVATAGAGAATNGAGGCVVLRPGLPNGATAVGGTVIKRLNSYAGTVAAAGIISVRQLFSGYVTVGSGAAPYAYTLPTSAAIVAAIPGCTVGDSFDVLINNAVAFAGTLTANAVDQTIVGTAAMVASGWHILKFICTNATAGTEAWTVLAITIA